MSVALIQSAITADTRKQKARVGRNVMRLKQLLSSVGMLLILSTVAFAANTQSAAAPAIAASQSVAANKSAAPAPASVKPAATPTSSSVATPAPVVVRNVSVVQGDGTISVEIATNGPITPKATRLSAPARIVLDFPTRFLPDATR